MKQWASRESGDAAAKKSADRVAFVITGEPHVIALGYESWLAGLTSEVSHSLAAPTGFEPATHGLGNHCSIP